MALFSFHPAFTWPGRKPKPGRERKRRRRASSSAGEVDLFGALRGLGYKAPRARHAARKAAKGGGSFESQLRRAINEAAKGIW